MAAVMRLLGWSAKGLRCPDHEMHCHDPEGKPYAVSLIQMPNGTGKTTTLTLLRAALSGSGQEWVAERVIEFRKRGSNQSTGEFEVRLLLNELRTTILMLFDFENGHVSYKTTHGPGRREDFHPPADFLRFMNRNFVKFYVFDGELAEHLLDKGHTDAKVVVDTLFQLNTFDSMDQEVDEYWRKQARNSGATEQRGLSRRRNRVKTLERRIAKLKHERTRLQDERARAQEDLLKKQGSYQQRINKGETRSQALYAAEDKVKELAGIVREEALDVLDRMRDPSALSVSFANGLIALKDSLDRVKLPESAAREFFEDLAQEAKCVCGRLIDPEIAETIRTRASQYLGAEDVSFLNSMKSTIKDAVGETLEQGEQDLQTGVSSLSRFVEKERSARNDFDALRLEAEQTDPEIKRAAEDIKGLQKKIELIDKKLEKYESNDPTQNDERTYGIDVLESRHKRAERKLAEITSTLTTKAKRDILREVITSAREKSRRGIAKELCAQANERISELMPHNSILVDRIAENLILKGQDAGSAGETLSIAYAFLATLFHRAEHQLPFVVDSPAGPIDLAVRPKIGELIPRLSGQFIAFTISSERANFIEPLKRASESEIQFVTLFRKGAKELEIAARESVARMETIDGWTVQGEEFFNEFQLEEEETD